MVECLSWLNALDSVSLFMAAEKNTKTERGVCLITFSLGGLMRCAEAAERMVVCRR